MHFSPIRYCTCFPAAAEITAKMIGKADGPTSIFHCCRVGIKFNISNSTNTLYTVEGPDVYDNFQGFHAVLFTFLLLDHGERHNFFLKEF